MFNINNGHFDPIGSVTEDICVFIRSVVKLRSISIDFIN